MVIGSIGIVILATLLIAIYYIVTAIDSIKEVNSKVDFFKDKFTAVKVSLDGLEKNSMSHATNLKSIFSALTAINDKLDALEKKPTKKK